MDVVGKAVHEHRSRAIGGTGLVIGDIEHTGIDTAERFEAFCRGCTRNGKGLLGHVNSTAASGMISLAPDDAITISHAWPKRGLAMLRRSEERRVGKEC